MTPDAAGAGKDQGKGQKTRGEGGDKPGAVATAAVPAAAQTPAQAGAGGETPVAPEKPTAPDNPPTPPVDTEDRFDPAEIVKNHPEAVAQAKAILAAAGLKVVDQDEPEPEDQDVYDVPASLYQGDGTDRRLVQGGDILMDACDIYGVNPNPELKPLELMSWKYYQADQETGAPAYVQLVTAGGTKLRHYADGVIDEGRDPNTAMVIRQRLGLFGMDPIQKVAVPLPLPSDLTLPEEAVTGRRTVQTPAEHVYAGGYLRSGGRSETQRRAEVRAARSGGPLQPVRRRRR